MDGPAAVSDDGGPELTRDGFLGGRLHAVAAAPRLSRRDRPGAARRLRSGRAGRARARPRLRRRHGRALPRTRASPASSCTGSSSSRPTPSWRGATPPRTGSRLRSTRATCAARRRRSAASRFDLVLANPPFHPADGDARRATRDATAPCARPSAGLGDWIAAGLRRLAPGRNAGAGAPRRSARRPPRGARGAGRRGRDPARRRARGASRRARSRAGAKGHRRPR